MIKATPQLVDITSVIVNPDNPRLIKDEKFRQLVESLREFPGMLQIRPIVVDEYRMVLGGNMRLRACLELQWTEIWIVQVFGLTPEQKREFIIKDNLAFGEWDWEILANEWDMGQLTLWGVDVPDLKIADAEEDDQYVEPEDIKTEIKPGQLIRIGPHRLLCGDARRSEDQAALMAGRLADLAFNDPPYGMKKEAAGITNDNLNLEELLEFNRLWIPDQLQHLKPNGSFYCWGTELPLMDIFAQIFRPMVSAGQATFRNLITWDKGAGQGQLWAGARLYAVADEKCLFIMLGKETLNRKASDFPEEWRPILTYFKNERTKMGWSAADVRRIIGKTTASHYFSESQFLVPTWEHYRKLQEKAEGKAFTRPFEDIKREVEEHREAFWASRAYFDNTHDNMNSVWHFTRTPQQDRDHPHVTPKPIALCSRAIKTSCPDQGLVIDFFAGSGQTMLAAHQLGRTCYAMEIEPKHCQIIVDRMAQRFPGLEITVN